MVFICRHTEIMKYVVIALIALMFYLKPLQGLGQSRGKMIHVYESADQKLVSGRLVAVADSTITVIRKAGSPDTVQICCKSIYSIKQAKTVTGELGAGVLNGVFLTIMVADNQRAESSTSAAQQGASSAYVDALATGFTYLLMDSNARKEPIVIDYSYARFRAFAPDLLMLLNAKP
jgi:hypothetical protein